MRQRNKVGGRLTDGPLLNGVVVPLPRTTGSLAEAGLCVGVCRAIRQSLLLLLLVGISLCLLPRASADATDDDSVESASVGWIIATRAAPPFSIPGNHGDWSGVSISLWKRIASELQIDYRFEEASLEDLVKGVADGRYAASVAATTITPFRESLVDFSHPFHSTGFGVVVRSAHRSWWAMAGELVTFEFLTILLVLACVLALVGLCFWLAEHKQNPDEFRPRFFSGLGDGFWFSAVTMTTVGYGDKAPRTLAGRMVALVWMFSALVIISSFTGLIASQLTASRLAMEITDVRDLRSLSLGSIAGTSSDDWLVAQGLTFSSVGSVRQGMRQVVDGQIDAFVYDRPLLAYLQSREFHEELRLVASSFGRQRYGIALPQGSDHREAVNGALLRYLDSDEWDSVLLRYLGQEN